MRNLLVISFLLFVVQLSFAQVIFEQDVVKNGGITGAGFSGGLGYGSGAFDIFIEPGAIVKKAYLFCYRVGYPYENEYVLNNDTIVFDTTNLISSFGHLNEYFEPINLYYCDYTSDLDPGITHYDIELPVKTGDPINWGYCTIYMVVVYESPSLSGALSYEMVFNDQDCYGFEAYSSVQLNKVDYNYPVGFALYTDRYSGSLTDFVYDLTIASNYIGSVGGNDQVNSAYGAAGVKGHFYYQNQTLYGLDDDTPDAFVDSTDGLADISGYIDQVTNSFDFSLRHEDYPNNIHISTGVSLGYFVSYTTTCDTFTVDVPAEYLACKGDSIQLTAAGGSQYEWLPQKDLSCYTCPQPYFSGDTSQVYRVRVWNNDSCSKVLPVSIRVVDKPEPPVVSVSPTRCSDSSGIIEVDVVENTHQYLINNGSAQSSNVFDSLSFGSYLVTTVDTNNCTASTDVFVDQTFPVAAFQATPQEGDVPLDVQFYNQSLYGYDYLWYIDDDTLTTTSPQVTFDEEGTYEVTLITYDQYPQCADTASLYVHAEYPLVVFAPSLHTDRQAPYQIYTTGVDAMTYELYNEIGQLVIYEELTPSTGHTELWQPYELAKGVYFYRIVVTYDQSKEKVFAGKVVRQ
ncbi:PKD domain-containing protein [Parvicella tangerina]|uniref:PKD/Chitinase domain-containing protein n=1 Tax=Parvicella tangerina TaxID=2829795 RepID=A0A916NFH7_9FLAO|nr:PKD domain-containing protein [Parvicella tangerina]CAG5078554.1 hypothetical protein CRYO30217_00706 [Parvicella tangerina]